MAPVAEQDIKQLYTINQVDLRENTRKVVAEATNTPELAHFVHVTLKWAYSMLRIFQCSLCYLLIILGTLYTRVDQTFAPMWPSNLLPKSKNPQTSTRRCIFTTIKNINILDISYYLRETTSSRSNGNQGRNRPPRPAGAIYLTIATSPKGRREPAY